MSRRGSHGSERGAPPFCFGDSGNISDGPPREHFDRPTFSRALHASAKASQQRRHSQEGCLAKEHETVGKRLPPVEKKPRSISKRALSPPSSDCNESEHPKKRHTLHATTAYEQTHNQFREENLSGGKSTDKFKTKAVVFPREKAEVILEAKSASKPSVSPRRHGHSLNKDGNIRRASASTGALQSQQAMQSTHCDSESQASAKSRIKSVVVVAAKQATVGKQTSGKKNETIDCHRPATKDCPRSSLALDKNRSRLDSTSNTITAREAQISGEKGNSLEPVLEKQTGCSQQLASGVHAFSRQTTSPDSTTHPSSKHNSGKSKCSQLQGTGHAEETRPAASYISGSPSRQTANRFVYRQDNVDGKVIRGDAFADAHDRGQRSNVSSSSVSLDLDIVSKLKHSCDDLDIPLQSPPTPLYDESTEGLNNIDSPSLRAAGGSAKYILSSRTDVNTVVAQWLQKSHPGKSGEGNASEKSPNLHEVLQSSNSPVMAESCLDIPLFEAGLPAGSTGNCDCDQDTVSLSSEESLDDLILVSETFAPLQAAKETFGDSALRREEIEQKTCQRVPPPALPFGAILSGTVGMMEAVLFELHTYTMLSVLDFCRDPHAKEKVLSLFRQGNSTSTREACANEMYRLVRATVEGRRAMWKGLTSVLRKLSKLRWTLQPTESGILPRIQEICELENVRDVHDSPKTSL